MSYCKGNSEAFADQLEELADRLEISVAIGRGAVGFAVIDADSHETAIAAIHSVASSAVGHDPELIASTNLDQLGSMVLSILNRGRSEQSRLQTISLVDLTSIDYDNPDNREAVGKLLFGINMGRTLLARSALATVLAVPEAHFSLFQELPDLYSTREFVLKFTRQVS